MISFCAALKLSKLGKSEEYLLIYDSNNSNMLNIPYVNFPASDHLPVETTIN